MLGTIGIVGRFKPLHNGGALLLETLCKQADKVIIGIGSSNKYNARNPFTAKESEEMIRLTINGNYEIIFVPDFAHIPGYEDGQKWRQYIKEHFGKLDHFASGNPYVSKLLEGDYDIIDTSTLVPAIKQTRATEVRVEMAKNGDWQRLVPKQVADYIFKNKLDERFRKEFGTETLERFADKDCNNDILKEKMYAEEK